MRLRALDDKLEEILRHSQKTLQAKLNETNSRVLTLKQSNTKLESLFISLNNKTDQILYNLVESFWNMWY